MGVTRLKLARPTARDSSYNFLRRRKCTVTLRWIPVLVLAQLGSFGLMQAQPKGQEHWVATWATAQDLVRPGSGRDRPRRRRSRTSAGSRRPRHHAAGHRRARPQQSDGAHDGAHQHRRKAAARSPVERLRRHAGGGRNGASRHPRERFGHRPGFGSRLSFNGKPGCTIGPGVVLFSDPVELNVPAVTELAVSLYFPGETGPPPPTPPRCITPTFRRKAT